MAEPSWQETLRLRLVERNAKETAYASIIEQCMCEHLHVCTLHVRIVTLLRLELTSV